MCWYFPLQSNLFLFSVAKQLNLWPCMSVCLFVCLSGLSVCLSVCLSVRPSVRLSVLNFVPNFSYNVEEVIEVDELDKGNIFAAAGKKDE